MTLKVVNLTVDPRPNKQVWVEGEVQDGNGNPVAWAMVQFGGVLSGGCQAGSLGTFIQLVNVTGEGNGTAVASSMTQQSPVANVSVTGPLLDPASLTASATGPDANRNYTVTVKWVAGWTVDLEVNHGFQWNCLNFGGSGADTTTANGSEGWTNSMTAMAMSSPVGATANLTVMDSWGIVHGNSCKVTQG